MRAETLARMCETLDIPMAVVTAFDGREHSGCLVGFHTQCSIAPPRWLVSISKENHTYRVALAADWLVVHFLRADQHDLALLFGGETGDAIGPENKFERTPWHTGPGNTPILDGCDWVAGRLIERIDAGDHVAHILDITDGRCERAGAPRLGFNAARDIRPGHRP
ncbi:MAG TPA: flavin reductase family protein [Candidatus Lustribacter sp.]